MFGRNVTSDSQGDYIYRARLQGRAPDLVNFVDADEYHFFLALPAAFTQPGDHLLAEPSSVNKWTFNAKFKQPPDLAT